MLSKEATVVNGMIRTKVTCKIKLTKDAGDVTPYKGYKILLYQDEYFVLVKGDDSDYYDDSFETLSQAKQYVDNVLLKSKVKDDFPTTVKTIQQVGKMKGLNISNQEAIDIMEELITSNKLSTFSTENNIRNAVIEYFSTKNTKDAVLFCRPCIHYRKDTDTCKTGCDSEGVVMGNACPYDIEGSNEKDLQTACKCYR